MPFLLLDFDSVTSRPVRCGVASPWLVGYALGQGRSYVASALKRRRAPQTGRSRGPKPDGEQRGDFGVLSANQTSQLHLMASMADQ